MDSTHAVAKVWADWAQYRGLPAEQVIAHAHGRRSIETIRAFAPELDAARENLKVEQMEIEAHEGVVALAGADYLLRCLPQDRVAVVTSATRALARARLDYAGLQIPKHIVSADDVIEGKPSPEPYLKGAELLGFAPQDCLVFEDAPAGISAAEKAAMRVIALPTTCPAGELSRAAAIVRSLNAVRIQVRDKNILIRIHRAQKT